MLDRYECEPESAGFPAQLSALNDIPANRPPENASRNGDDPAAISGAETAGISGAETSPSAEQRRKGARAARRLAVRLRGDRELSPDKLLLLDLTARLACHCQNLSLRLFADGEIKATDGDAKQALGRLVELSKLVADNLRVIFGDDRDDPLALMGRGP